MAIGIMLGITMPNFSAGLKYLGDAFIRAICMIVIPLVFAAVVLGVVKIGDFRKFGAFAGKAFFWFFIATGIAITLGIMLNDLFHPAAGVKITATGSIPANLYTSINWAEFFLEVIPVNVLASMAAGKILPTIFFAVCFGLSLAFIGDRGKVIIELLDSMFAAMFKLTEGVIAFAPFGVAGLMAWLMATQGTKVLMGLVKMVGTLYIGLLIMLILFWFFLHFFASINPRQTFKKVLEPLLLAFTTASSEVTLPVHMKILQQNGVPNRIVSFVLPLGYIFNMDGSALYQALAVSFIAEAYGIELSLASKLVIFGTLILASKGTANVPSASLVVMATVLTAMGMPVEGIAILAGVDRFMDMGRSAINVLGNTVAVLMVAKWEGVLGKTDSMPPTDVS
jgi:DAACS family dicarboxylate/amino acid:cation (Na+ or H+) symporter